MEMKALGRIAGVFVLLPTWVWAVLALYLFPAWPPAFRWVAVVTFLAVTAAAVWKLRGVRRMVALFGAVVCVRLLWMVNTPATDRDWAPGLERQPVATFDGDRVTILDVRHASYRTTDDFDVVWEDRHYDLRDLRTVDFMVEPFSAWRGLAHTLVTFGFADGEQVAISVETRRERGESYSPLRGLFRHYELIYIVGDERDLIGLRANIRRDPVHLYPMRATREQVRALFVTMLQRANRLAEHPEFYDSLFSTCTSNIRRHVASMRESGLRPGWRTVFPGYSDELAWELGLVDFDGTFEEARQHFLVNDRSAFDDGIDGREWSRRIRATDAGGG